MTKFTGPSVSYTVVEKLNRPMNAASIRSLIASCLPQRARWLVDNKPDDYSFYSDPRNLSAVMAEWQCDLSDVEQVPDFIVFGEYDHDEGLAHPLLVVRQSDGKVFRVDVEADEPLVLLNSTLQAFIDTFCLLDKYLGHDRPIPADLHSLVRDLDPTVYSESWWYNVVGSALSAGSQ